MYSSQSYELFLLIQVVKFCFSSGFTVPERLSSNKEQSVDFDISNLIRIDSFGENAFIDPDVEVTGNLVANFNETSNQNPEELGMYFEGDIRLPFQVDKRKGSVVKTSLWPNGIIPYEIGGKFSSHELAAIRLAFEEYHHNTCVRFKPRSKEKDYISIVNGRSGCWSAVGKMGGKQEVNLQSPQCLMKRGTPIHELMHVLGFIHEQNRYERDSYVIVKTENIKKNMEVNFVKSPQPSEHGAGIGYDYMSVMHYSPTSFSKNGKPTIEPKKNTKESKFMGQRKGFSAVDVAKINAMYNCKRNVVLQDSAYEPGPTNVDD